MPKPRRSIPRLLRWIAALLVLVPVLLLSRASGPETAATHRAEWLEAAGVQFRVVRAATAEGRSPTLVLIHGFGEHLLTWRQIFDRLAASHPVVAFDLPGFGSSGKPAGPYDLDSQAERVRAFLDTYVPGPLVLVGHSMGGEIAARLGMLMPDRVEALILIAPAGFTPGLGQIQEGLSPGGARAIGWWESARAFITPLHDPEWLAEDEPMASYDPLTDSSYRASVSAVLRDFDFGALRESFGDLRQPVLLIWGRVDPVMPYGAAAQLDSVLPCSRLESLQALHRPQVERPDTVASLILDFARRRSCEG